MSLGSQLNLQVPEVEDSQLDLFTAPVDEEIEINLYPGMTQDVELARWRRRALFLTSVFLHIFLLIFIAYAPDLIRRGRILMGIPVSPAPEKQITTLFLPPDLLKSLRQPPPEARPSDKNREAQGRAPKIDPNGIHAPFSRGNTPEPEAAKGPPPTPPPMAETTPPPAPPAPAPAAPKPDSQSSSSLRLDDVAPQTNSPNSLRMPSLTPGQAIQQSLQEAARGGYHPENGPGAGGDSLDQFNNLHPNFSTEAPTILSDTRGVDFGPYLARIVYIVRRNWLAVIPESARLGEKGRVAIVFEILKDGTVPQMRMVASSGSDPLDRAAMTGIRASSPFPPLPSEFTGEHLVLQFIFLYNLQPGQ